MKDYVITNTNVCAVVGKPQYWLEPHSPTFERPIEGVDINAIHRALSVINGTAPSRSYCECVFEVIEL